MSDEHRRRATEWWCYLHSTKPAPPATLIRPEHWQPPAATLVTIDEPETTNGYDTTTTAEEGLWARTGWAGRPT